MPIGRRMGRPGLIGMAARTAVVAGTAQATAGAVSHRQQNRYNQQQADARPRPHRPGTGASTGSLPRQHRLQQQRRLPTT